MIELTSEAQLAFLLENHPAVLSASWDDRSRRGRATFASFGAARRAEADWNDVSSRRAR